MKDSTPQAVRDCHALLLWLIPQLDKFPRARRFTLGERLEGILLAVLENLVEAAYTRATSGSSVSIKESASRTVFQWALIPTGDWCAWVRNRTK